MITVIPRQTRHGRVASACRVVGSSHSAQANAAARNLAYRRLATVILGLDVPTLSARLQSARQAEMRLRTAA